MTVIRMEIQQKIAKQPRKPTKPKWDSMKRLKN